MFPARVRRSPPTHHPQGLWGPSPPHLQRLPAAVGQSAQGVPLVTDLLAASVDVVGVIVIQLAAGQAGDSEAQAGVGSHPLPQGPQDQN